MLGVAILLVVLAVPYLIVNVRRLRSGKRWAYTFCALGRDWEERMRAQTRERRAQADLRAADPPPRRPARHATSLNKPAPLEISSGAEI